MIDDVGGGTAGAWDKGTWDNVNPLGPLDGGTAGGRVTDVGVLPPYIRKLEAVADVARVLIQGWMQMPPRGMAGELLSLADALDALDVEE